MRRSRSGRIEPFVPERRGGARDGRRARGCGQIDNGEAAVREALARDLGYRRVGPGGRRLRRGRSLARQHHPRPRDRPATATLLARGVGGYSGPALRPIALACVYACARAVDLPIVGMGGVPRGRDVLDLIAAGANASPLAPFLFADPDAPRASGWSSRASRRAKLPARDGRGSCRFDPARLCQRSDKKKDLQIGKTVPLDPRRVLLDLSGSWSRPRCRPRLPHARSISGWRRSTGERHPGPPREAEEGSEGRDAFRSRCPSEPARVRLDGEGLRHAHGGTQVRSGEGGAAAQPVPDQPVEDGGRALRAAAGRAVGLFNRGRLLSAPGPRAPSSSSPAPRVRARARYRARDRAHARARGGRLGDDTSAEARASRTAEYWFLTDDEFVRRVAAGDFLEWVPVRLGHALRDAPLGDRPHRGRGAGARPGARARGRARACRTRSRERHHLHRCAVVAELERRLRERATECDGGDRRAHRARARPARAGASEFRPYGRNDDVEPRDRGAGGDRRAELALAGTMAPP